MNLIEQHFEEALRDMPQKKLSFWANRRVKKMIRQRLDELEGRSFWRIFLPRLVAVPVALMLILTSTGAYGFYSPTVIQSDLLYVVKERGEVWRYPTDKDPEERITYHLWLSDRRYDEVREILKRKTGQEIVLIPRAKADHSVQDESENGDPLDAILQSTLQRAAENVETAFVIAEEIRELPKVVKVKEQIAVAVEKRRQWFMKAKPVLAQVQLKKSQIERRKRLSVIREQAQQRGVQELALFPEIINPESTPSTASVDLVSQPTGSEPSHPPLPQLPFPFLPIPSLPILLPDPPPTTDTLMEETIAFQQALLSHLEEVISSAEDRQEERVKIVFEEFLEPQKKRELREPRDEARDARKAREARKERKERKIHKERQEEKEEPVEIASDSVEAAAGGELSESLAEATEPEIPELKKEKDECEKKADKVCEKSDEKDCQEKVVKECREEKEKKERKDNEKSKGKENR